MLVDKWDDSGADGNVDGCRWIFVSLICRLRREIKVSLIIILLQPLDVKYPSQDIDRTATIIFGRLRQSLHQSFSSR